MAEETVAEETVVARLNNDSGSPLTRGLPPTTKRNVLNDNVLNVACLDTRWGEPTGGHYQ